MLKWPQKNVSLQGNHNFVILFVFTTFKGDIKLKKAVFT